MNLTIDIGNSRTKFTIFHNNRIENLIYQSNEADLNLILKNELNNYSINSIIICSVNNFIPDNILKLKNKTKKFIIFSHKTKIPIKNLYTSPKLLGLDRLAAAIGANSIYPNNNCLIIDAGTAITFDIINEKSEFIGGSISLGLTTRYKSLAHFTKKLPEIEFNENYEYPAKNTESSIHAGIQMGIIYETEGYIKYIEQRFSNLKIIVTGGDFNFFVKNIKKTIFAEPNLVAIGLNRIIEINENKK